MKCRVVQSPLGPRHTSAFVRTSNLVESASTRARVARDSDS